MALTDMLTSVQTSAGKGTRCRPLSLYSATSMIPKGLLRIMGLPFAELQLAQFKAAGILDNYIITQYLENREHLSSRFGNGSRFGMRIHYSDPSDDRINNGSGHAVLTNIERKELTGHSIILANDNVYEIDFEKAMKWHIRNNAVISIMTVLLRPRDTIKNYGLVTAESDYRISALDEKPETEQELMKILGITNQDLLKDMRVPINTAGYLVNNNVLRKIAKEDWVQKLMLKSSGEFDMAGKLIKELIRREYAVFNHPINAWGDFGSTTFFLDTFPEALSGKFPFIYRVLEQQGYYHDEKNNVWIDPDTMKTTNADGKTLKERMVSGRVKIGPNVFVGRGVIIEDGAQISYSDLEKYSKIGPSDLNRVYVAPYCEINGEQAELSECALGLQTIVNSTNERPTRIGGRTVTGPEIIVPEGSYLNNVKIFPGCSFKEPVRKKNKILVASDEQIQKIAKEYGPSKEDMASGRVEIAA